jgi:hypothetical protein
MSQFIIRLCDIKFYIKQKKKTQLLGIGSCFPSHLNIPNVFFSDRSTYSLPKGIIVKIESVSTYKTEREGKEDIALYKAIRAYAVVAAAI